jgi:hypothetical protein
MKIAVHITHYNQVGSQNTGPLKLNKFDYLEKILKTYLSISKNIKIFIHTNDNKLISKNRKIAYIYHDLRKEHDHNILTWKCRSLIKRQLKKFDIFIYSEDDILFTKKNLEYWHNYKNECLVENYNLGFLLCEYDNKKKDFYTVRINNKLSKYIFLNNNKYIINDINPYYCFWIYDSKELEKFTRTKWWNFSWSGNNFNSFYGLAEMSAVGWHGKNMDRYHETILPLKNEEIVNGSLLHHLPNNYINKTYIHNKKKISYCIYKFKEVVEYKHLQKPYSKLKKIIENLILKINFIFFRKIQRSFYT